MSRVVASVVVGLVALIGVSLVCSSCGESSKSDPQGSKVKRLGADATAVRWVEAFATSDTKTASELSSGELGRFCGAVHRMRVANEAIANKLRTTYTSADLDGEKALAKIEERWQRMEDGTFIGMALDGFLREESPKRRIYQVRYTAKSGVEQFCPLVIARSQDGKWTATRLKHKDLNGRIFGHVNVTNAIEAASRDVIRKIDAKGKDAYPSMTAAVIDIATISQDLLRDFDEKKGPGR